MKLLWTNASVGSDFAAQTINLSLTDYAAVIITFTHYKGQGNYRSQFILKGSTGNLQSINAVDGQTGAIQNGLRYATVNSSNIKFNGGYYSQSGGGMNANNGICVPYKIYGIKGVT